MAGNPVCNISKVRQNNTMLRFLNCLVKHQNQGWKDGYAGDYTEDNTLAITTPRSSPKVKLMKHNAINPATVVMELPTTEVMVFEIACAMARFLSPETVPDSPDNCATEKNGVVHGNTKL